MPVETFGFPDSLNASFPPTSDGLVGGDDHIRGIKSTIKNTFPNVTGAITATHTRLNQVANDGADVLDDDGVFFKTSGDGFVNTLAGDIDVKLQGTIAATFQRTSGANFFKVKGALQVDESITSTKAITGPGIAPIGAMVMWLSNTLPPTSEGVWVWANGAAYLKADYPIANSRIGDATASTTFSVINMQEVSPIGRSGMGGAASPGLLTTIAAGVKDLLGALFGAQTVSLTGAQNGPHYHSAAIYDPTHSHGVGGTGNGSFIVAGGGGSQSGGGSFGIPNGSVFINAAGTGVRVNSSNGLDTTYSAGSGEAHPNIHPVRAVNFIVRLA